LLLPHTLLGFFGFRFGAVAAELLGMDFFGFLFKSVSTDE
jgi:hypothetical protein